MTIEILIYPGLFFLAVALIAKLIERRRDVLYGPYIEGRKTVLGELRDRCDAVTGAIGVRREYGRLAVKLTPVSIFASAVIG
jgi:hypothetical protein